MKCASYEAIEEAYNNWVAGFVINNPGCFDIEEIEGIPSLPEDVTCAGANLSYTLHVEDDCSSDECTSTFVVTPCSESCETAYGYQADSKCFMDNDVQIFNNWGWTNYITGPTVDQQTVTTELKLYAGTPVCDPTGYNSIGTVYVEYTYDGVLTLHYVMDDPYYMSQVHVNVGCEEFPHLNKKKLTVAPGQYTYGDDRLDKVTEYTVRFTGVSGNIWVIAHAVTCEVRYCSPDYNPDGGQYVFDKPLDCNKSAMIATGETGISNFGDLKVYPNPFKDVLNIEFVSGISGHATLEIQNIAGQRVATLMDKYIEAGQLQKVEFRPNAEVSGMYFYRLDIEGEIQIGKVIYRKE